MRTATRVSSARCIVSAATSTSPTCASTCRTLFVPVPLASGTSQSTSTRRDSFLPLPVPTAVWTDIGLDFVEALPKVRGKSVILTVVDRFSKYCHFIPLAHPYSAESVAQAFFADIVRLHGMPQSLVSDQDPIFTSTLWRELMRLMGAKLHMTTAFHP